jgi:hypothetical protein
MKLKALEDRSRAKLGTDVLDIGALVRDQATADVAVQQLLSAPSQLRDDAAAHVERWLVRRRREVWDAARLVTSRVGMDDIAATADFLLRCLED